VADVAIVGAGYSGLWTAYWLTERDPDLDVVVVERDHVGFGASGRNGGWVSALLPSPLQSFARAIGEAKTVALQTEMFGAVREIGEIGDRERIDCHYHRGGTISLVADEPQRRRAENDVDDYQRFGFQDHVQMLDRSSTRVHVAVDTEAVFRPDCAVVHPRRLVDGLAAAVERRGVRIFEGTTVSAVRPGEITTERGRIRARYVIDCREAYAAATSRRRIVPIYSLMIATEPLDDETWRTIGLPDRETLTDHRRQLVYAQRTRDGRLAFGGRGVGYRLGSRISDDLEGNARVHDDLRSSMVGLFPSLADVRVTHQWGGPLAAPRDWMWTVDLDHGSGTGVTGGYVGDGVTSAFVAGRVMADAIVRGETDFPLFGHRSPRWEREPIRWLGINALSRLAGVLDRRESRGRSTGLLGRTYDRLLG
jgi:glycine/D-amino acid oxidase-like deaminating enzyme